MEGSENLEDLEDIVLSHDPVTLTVLELVDRSRNRLRYIIRVNQGDSVSWGKTGVETNISEEDQYDTSVSHVLFQISEVFGFDKLKPEDYLNKLIGERYATKGYSADFGNYVVPQKVIAQMFKKTAEYIRTLKERGIKVEQVNNCAYDVDKWNQVYEILKNKELG